MTQQPLQFSLGRLLVLIALIALALWLFGIAQDSPENGAAAAAAIPLVLGTAIGGVLGRAGVGAIATVVVYCVLGWFMVQLEDEPMVNGNRRGVFQRRRVPVASARVRPNDFIHLMNIRANSKH